MMLKIATVELYCGIVFVICLILGQILSDKTSLCVASDHTSFAKV